ncbi:MAG: ABC transporter permease [Actinomycetes bacterium]|jgi:peptide/nickel transport system permease protein|nr:ABC transporter permease [Actinomycetes bacterium]
MKASTKRKLKSFFTIPTCISLAVLLAILFIAIFAPKLAPYDPNEIDITAMLQKPSDTHVLGTDKDGRDLISRLMVGSRITIISAFSVVVISAIIGIPYGLISGYYGGWIDQVLMRISDVLLSFPSLLLAFIFVAAFGRGITNSVVALGIVYVPMLARLTRSLVLVEKNKVYVEAAHSIGYSDFHILAIEILPNCISTLVVQMMLDIGYAILDLAAMSFLGLGVQPPTADWGAMLEEGRIVITSSPLVALAPGLMIIITVVALNIFGEGVQAYLDPSQRKLPNLRKFRRYVRIAHADLEAARMLKAGEANA